MVVGVASLNEAMSHGVEQIGVRDPIVTTNQAAPVAALRLDDLLQVKGQPRHEVESVVAHQPPDKILTHEEKSKTMTIEMAEKAEMATEVAEGTTLSTKAVTKINNNQEKLGTLIIALKVTEAKITATVVVMWVLRKVVIRVAGIAKTIATPEVAVAAPA